MIIGKPALIIHEMQKFVVDPQYAGFPALAQQVTDRGIAKKIAALATAFRKAGAPVFHTPARGRPDRADVKINTLIAKISMKGTPMPADHPAQAYVEGCEFHEGDFEIARSSGMTAMVGTQLDTLMRRMDIETVVVTGVSVNVGVAGNVMVASELGYHVLVPDDCVAASDWETHRAIVDNQMRMIARVVQSEDVLAQLAG
jgi:nicotinamidase-related amidase